MKISVYQSANSPNWERNLEKAVATCRSTQGLIVAPELFLTGYDFSKIEEAVSFTKTAIPELSSVCRERKNDWVGSFVVQEGKQLFNRQLLLNSKIEYDKVNLFPLLKEDKHITPGKTISVFPVDKTGFTAGLGICYDLRFPELFRRLTYNGANLFLLSAQWPASRMEHFRSLVVARALENQAFMVAANASGETAKTIMGGHSLVVSPMGDVLFEGDADEVLKAVEISPEEARQYRNDFPAVSTFIEREKNGNSFLPLRRF